MEPPGPVEVLASLFNAAAAVSFGYISIALARLYLKLGAALDAPIAFLSLSIAHMAAALAPLAPEREAFSLYTATGSLTAASLAILLASTRGGKAPAAPLVVAPAALAVSADLMAALAALIGTARFSGPARLLALAFTASFTLRLASLALLPSSMGAVLLLAGEAIRAVAAALLAGFYVAGMAGFGWQEEK